MFRGHSVVTGSHLSLIGVGLSRSITTRAPWSQCTGLWKRCPCTATETFAEVEAVLVPVFDCNIRSGNPPEPKAVKMVVSAFCCALWDTNLNCSGLLKGRSGFAPMFSTTITIGELRAPTPLVVTGSWSVRACNWPRDKSLRCEGWKIRNNITPMVKQHSSKSIADITRSVASGALAAVTTQSPGSRSLSDSSITRRSPVACHRSSGAKIRSAVSAMKVVEKQSASVDVTLVTAAT